MKTNKFNYELYKNLSKLTQDELFESLEAFLAKKYTEDRVVVLDDGFIYAVGDIPICLVAHLDTVHKTLPTNIYYDQEHQVIWSPQGIGADDRAGVYGIIDLIKRGLRPHILFTCDEEIGGLGAQVAADMIEGTVDFCIELDRRGQNDSVYYDCDNDDFEEYINSFGFKTAWGSFSDICFVCPAWKVAGVNLSIGYQNEHTSSEILNVDWMMSTIDKVQKILYNKEYDKEKFDYVESPHTYQSGYNWNYADTNFWSKYGETYGKSTPQNKQTYSKYGLKNCEDICDECGTIHFDTDLIPIGSKLFCNQCYGENFSFCSHCSTVYAKGTTCRCV